MEEQSSSALESYDNITIEVTKNSETNEYSFASYPRIIPIQEGVKFNCGTGACYFAPMVSIKTNSAENIVPIPTVVHVTESNS